MTAFQFFTVSLFVSLSFSSCREKELTAQAIEDTKTKVEMVTNYGTIILELYNETPLHRDNFIKLVNEKKYDSLLFHRVIENFMIQGGDPDSWQASQGSRLGEGDLGYTVKAEFREHLFHKKGALASAREDNQDRASSAIQFFIVQGKLFNDSLLNVEETRINNKLAKHEVINDTAFKDLWDSLQKAIKEEDEAKFRLYSDRIDTIAKTYKAYKKYTIPQSHRMVYRTIGGTPHLDQNYTVFGEVIKGMEIVDSIATTETDQYDRPLADIKIQSVKILEK